MTCPTAQSRRRVAAIILPPSARSTSTTFSTTKACGFAPRTASTACSKRAGHGRPERHRAGRRRRSSGKESQRSRS
eukprot:9505469-Alexandrium_andersonii.AAC.1